MLRVLVVDDAAIDRRLAGSFLKRAGMDVAHAEDGIEALRMLERRVPDVVITDLNMPKMDGLDLVEVIRRDYPALPVILMTAHGSEEIAVQALRSGAASYVPKRNLARDLVETVEEIVSVARQHRHEQHLVDSLCVTESRFLLDNDIAAIPAVVGHLEESLARMRICDENGRLQVAVALREALVNAVYHGNLEVSSALLNGDGAAFDALVQQRRQTRPYSERRVHISARETRDHATYIVRDEGPGFDPTTLPDPTDIANLEKPCGRGLLLIRTFMDEVHHNERGNEITLVLRRRDMDPT